MNEKLVSIVMVNYNQERFIKEAIDSVIAQTYQNWELIIVDDGSTDQSVDIIKNYDDDRIKPIYLEENSHICIATNVGFSHVTGEYIARLDSDDVWEKEKLYKQVALLEEKPNARVCFTQVNLIDENGQNINEKESELLNLYNSRQKDRKDWIRFFFFIGNSLLQTLVFDRRLLEEVGNFNLAYCQSHDFEFLIRLIKKTDFYFVEEKLAKYRRTQTQQNSALTEQNNRRFFNEYMDIRAHFFEGMSDELFKNTFQDLFVNQAAETHEELVCEQAFLLSKCIGYSMENPILGMQKLAQLLNDGKIYPVLKEKYGYTSKKYYQDNTQKQFYTKKDEYMLDELREENKRLKQENENQKNHVEVLIDLKEHQQMYIGELERELAVMKNSRSWKVTRPFRKVVRRVRTNSRKGLEK